MSTLPVTPPFTAAEQRLIDATVTMSRLAGYLNLEPAVLREALGVCGVLTVKDEKNIIAAHEALFPDWEAVPP